jgi:hypothetical protein
VAARRARWRPIAALTVLCGGHRLAQCAAHCVAEDH